MPIRNRLIAAGASGLIVAAGSIAYLFEGEKRQSYQDPVGIWTACIGHVDASINHGQTFTEEQCSQFFHRDLSWALSAVEKCTPSVPDAMKPALVSFVFNVGNNAYCQSALAGLANKGDLCGACNQLSRWIYATKPDGTKVVLPGLVKRREAERKSCLDGALGLAEVQL